MATAGIYPKLQLCRVDICSSIHQATPEEHHTGALKIASPKPGPPETEILSHSVAEHREFVLVVAVYRQVLDKQIPEAYTPMRILEDEKCSGILGVLHLEWNQIILPRSAESQSLSLLETCHGIEGLFQSPNFPCGVVWRGTWRGSSHDFRSRLDLGSQCKAGCSGGRRQPYEQHSIRHAHSVCRNDVSKRQTPRNNLDSL